MCVYVKNDLELLYKYNFIIYFYKFGYCLQFQKKYMYYKKIMQ